MTDKPTPTDAATPECLTCSDHGAVGNSGFDHKTAADLLNNKTVSDEAVRKFVATSRWAHDERSALSATLLAMHGVLTSREAEIALLKKALMEAEAAPGPVSDTQHSQFLSDVLTAAGLITHGKRCKALGERLSDMVMRLRAAPQQEAQEPAVDDPTRWFTVVYRDISPGDEARLLGEHPKASAMSWSHAIRDRDAARAVLAKSGTQPQAGAVPQGWKAVPVNPTPEMWKAAKSVPDPSPPYPPHYGLVWDAMLAASPTPPAEQTFITPETGNSASAKGAAITSESGTPPADQQAAQVIINFPQVGTAGPFPVVDGRVSLPDSTMQDLVRMLRPTYEAEQQAQPDECFPGEPKVAVPQGLISAACFAIRNKRDGGKVLEQLRRYSVGDRSQPLAPQQAAPKAAPGMGNSGFDHQTAADFLSGKTVSDEALRKFVAASRGAHDARAALHAMMLSLQGELASREAEIALLKKALLEAEAAAQPAPAPLSDAQIAEMMRDTWGCASIAPRHALEFARAVERAHGITQKGGS